MFTALFLAASLCPQPPPPLPVVDLPVATAPTNAAVVFSLVPVVDYAQGDYSPLVVVSGGGVSLTGVPSAQSPGSTLIYLLPSSLVPAAIYSVTISDLGGLGQTVTSTISAEASGDASPPSAPGTPSVSFGEYVPITNQTSCPVGGYFKAHVSWSAATDDGPIVYAVESIEGAPTAATRPLVAAVTATSADIHVTPDRSLTLTVYAIDRAGHVTASAAANAASPGAPSSSKGGCSCEINRGAPPRFLALVLAALFALALRRRRQSVT